MKNYILPEKQVSQKTEEEEQTEDYSRSEVDKSPHVQLATNLEVDHDEQEKANDVDEDLDLE